MSTAEDDPVEPYEPLRTVAPGLHVVDGPWGPLGRRMTVMEVGGGDLAIHSAVRLRDPDLGALDALGRVRWILVPNPEHSTDASFYARRYPEARLLVPEEGHRKLARAGVGPIHGTLETEWPASLAGRLERASLRGLRLNPEVVFLHVATRTLVVCDFAFNMQASQLSWGVRQLMRLNGAVDRFGPTRFFRSMIVADARLLKESLAPVWAWDFDRVIVSHGGIVERDGKTRLQAACAVF
jgi:hypothetical protein